MYQEFLRRQEFESHGFLRENYFIIRHGEPEVYGVTKSPLTPNGVSQVEDIMQVLLERGGRLRRLITLN